MAIQVSEDTAAPILYCGTLAGIVPSMAIAGGKSVLHGKTGAERILTAGYGRSRRRDVPSELLAPTTIERLLYCQ